MHIFFFFKFWYYTILQDPGRNDLIILYIFATFFTINYFIISLSLIFIIFNFIFFTFFEFGKLLLCFLFIRKNYYSLKSIKRIKTSLMSHTKIIIIITVVVVIVAIIVRSFSMMLNLLWSIMMINCTKMMIITSIILMMMMKMLRLLCLWWMCGWWRGRELLLRLMMMMVMIMLGCCSNARRNHRCWGNSCRLIISTDNFHLFKFLVCRRHQLSSAGSIRRGFWVLLLRMLLLLLRQCIWDNLKLWIMLVIDEGRSIARHKHDILSLRLKSLRLRTSGLRLLGMKTWLMTLTRWGSCWRWCRNQVWSSNMRLLLTIMWIHSNRLWIWLRLNRLHLWGMVWHHLLGNGWIKDWLSCCLSHLELMIF